jgi:hypothetical protein
MRSSSEPFICKDCHRLLICNDQVEEATPSWTLLGRHFSTIPQMGYPQTSLNRRPWTAFEQGIRDGCQLCHTLENHFYFSTRVKPDGDIVISYEIRYGDDLEKISFLDIKWHNHAQPRQDISPKALGESSMSGVELGGSAQKKLNAQHRMRRRGDAWPVDDDYWDSHVLSLRIVAEEGR